MVNKRSGTLSQIFCLWFLRGVFSIYNYYRRWEKRSSAQFCVLMVFYSILVYRSIYLITVQVAGKHGDERGGADDAPRQEGCQNQGARGMADSLQSCLFEGYLMMLTINNVNVDLNADPDGR